MWRLENTAELEPVDPNAPDAAAPSPQVTTPASVGAGGLGGESDLRLADPTESARRAWREELAALGGPSPRLRFEDSPRTRIELSSTHPQGLARLIAGKRTRLSSLIRESFAWRTAQIAAEAILQKSSELAAARGIDAIRLGIVLADWDALVPSAEGEEVVEHFSAPVLLRPVRMRRAGDDYELMLRGAIELNPAFAAALAQQWGIVLDPETFVRLAGADGGFTPNGVIDALRGLTAHIPGFAIQPRLVLTSFAEVASEMVADAARLAHPVLDAIAGNPAAIETVQESWHEVEPVPSDQRSPQTDALLLDADEEQERVVARIAAGNSLVVRTLPGAGSTQTIVNAVGALASDGKRILVVGPRRASLQAIKDRLDGIGLTGLTASPSTARRDTVLAITRSEKAARPELDEVDDALVRLRSVIRDYREGLVRVDPKLGVTVLDCVSELSRLAATAPRATTTARLSRPTLERLASRTERERIASVCQAAGRYGEFKHAPGTSPWFGAQFTSADAASRAHELAVRLHAQQLPALVEKGMALIEGTHMRPFTNVHELGVYIRLLLDLRDTLDRFLPSVFDRSLTDLIAATGPKAESQQFSNSERRRLVKLAQEYLRPGVRVGDLHEALMRVQKQRVLWHRYVAQGATPRVPVGIAETQVALQAVEHDLAELDTPLGRTEDRRLARLPIADLRSTLAALAEESDALQNLQERSALMGSLIEVGLDPLVADFAARGVPVELMGEELELAWWKSALAGMLDDDRALLGANTDVVDRLEADFRLVDEAHAKGNAQRLAWRLAEQWRIGLTDWREEAELLKRTLRRDQVASGDLYRAAPHLTRALTPVWLASPYEMPGIDPTMPFDAVILVDAGAMTVAEAALAIRRGRQVVAFGDPVTQTPSPFETRVRDRRGTAGGTAAADEDRHDDSALIALSGLLRTFTLTRSYRAGGEDLFELVNRRFYSGRVVSAPWAGTFLGVRTLAVDHVEDARGMLNEDASAAESPDREVDRVVEHVARHAAEHPNESLMVVTPSRRHAGRVLAAVVGAVAKRPELAAFLARETDEAFDVLVLDHSVAISRDRVIVSLGYGSAVTGRVLADFGPLSRAGGDRLLASALTSARRGCTLVTAVAAEDLDPERVAAGVNAFRDVLLDVASPTPPLDRDGDGDPMVVDLAERLASRGATTRLGYRGELPLVARFGARCAVIETDADLFAGSLRESLRARPELLKRLGWHYVRVHAFELFQAPDVVADRIAELLDIPQGAPAVSGPGRVSARLVTAPGPVAAERIEALPAPASSTLSPAAPPVTAEEERPTEPVAETELRPIGAWSLGAEAEAGAEADSQAGNGLRDATLADRPAGGPDTPYAMNDSVEQAYVVRQELPTEPLQLDGFDEL